MSEQWCWKNSIELCCILQIREKNFFFSNFFNQSEFEKKSNSILRFFCHWNREISEQWCWKNSIDLCYCLQIRAKKFFFYQNFLTNEISRKKQIQLFNFFFIGIDRRANTDAEKIPLTFVVFSKSARKIFFLKFFQTIGFREKIKFNYSIFFSLESRDQWTVMLKKFYWPLLYSANPREKISFLSKFFYQWDFEKKSNTIIRFFCHYNREMSEQWCRKNSIDLRDILQNRAENFFFHQNFSTNQISRKNEIHLFDYFLIGIERWVNNDAEKIPLTFVVFSKSARINYFFANFFNQSDFEKKGNSFIRLFSHWNREMSEQWCWKNSIDLCWILQIRGKNFFLSNFFN